MGIWNKSKRLALSADLKCALTNVFPGVLLNMYIK